MFYLKVFWDCLVELKTKGLVILILTTMILSFFTIEGKIKENLNKLVFGNFEQTHFSLLITESIDYITIQDKLMGLPGVELVNIRKKDEIVSNIKKELKENSINLPESILEDEFIIFKIYLERDLSKKSINMIKKYLNKLLIDVDFSMSPVYYPSNKGKSEFFLKIMENSSSILIVLLIFIYQFFLVNLYKVIRLKSFIYENFQRKINLTYKVFFMGILSITLITNSVLIFLAKLDLNQIFLWITFHFIVFAILHMYFKFNKNNDY